MADPHRLVTIQLRPYKWEVMIASVLYAHKKITEDPAMSPFDFGLPRMLALVRQMEHQVECNEEEYATQD